MDIICSLLRIDNNLLLTERKGHTGEYWPEVRTKMTEGQYSPVWIELARLVSSLLWHSGMLVLNLPAFENKKYTTDGNDLYGGILTKKEPIRMLGFTSPYHNVHYMYLFASWGGGYRLYNNSNNNATVRRTPHA